MRHALRWHRSTREARPKLKTHMFSMCWAPNHSAGPCFGPLAMPLPYPVQYPMPLSTQVS